MNREQWLQAAVKKFRPLFASHDKPVPEKVRVSCGFPSTGGRSARRTTIGECWQPGASADSAYEIFISPVVQDAVEVLAILAHELCHAALPPGVGHRPPFGKLARAIGLEGKLTATVAGDAFKQWAAPALDKLGPYPHAKLDALRDRKKQSTRMVKSTCATCGYVARTTRKWINDVGAPHCPAHGEMNV